MRIAFVVNRYPPQVGGVELHVRNLGRELAALGHQVWVLTVAESGSERLDGEVRVLTGASSGSVAEIITFPKAGTTRRVAGFLREHRVDLVSTHTRFFPMSLVGVRAARKAGVPVVHTEHGSDFVAAQSPLVWLGSRGVDLSAGRYVLRHADRVLGVSPQAAAFASRLGGVKAEVFYNAITPPDPQLSRLDRPTRLVFVGRMVAGKGWDTFLEAVAALRAQGLELDAQMLGDGPQLDLASAKVNELGLAGVVKMLGRVSPQQVRSALAGATLVNPTVLSEGFQTTLLEAVAESGRVVTFEVPGARLLQEQGAPVAVCPRRSTESLVETLSGFLQAPPAPAGEELVAPWTWPVRARQYEQIALDALSPAR